MGCWNGTCMVSNLPIIAGEEAVGIFLVKIGSARQTDHCYSNEAWQPLLLPFRGIYNDYGLLEDIQEDWNTQAIVKYFQVNGVPVEAGDNPYHEREVNPEKIEAIDDLFEAWRDERLMTQLVHTSVRYTNAEKTEYEFVQEPYPAPVAFVMIHARVYDMMIGHTFSGWSGEHNLQSVVEKTRSEMQKEEIANRFQDTGLEDEELAELKALIRKNTIASLPLFQSHTCSNNILNEYYGSLLAWDDPDQDDLLLYRMAELDMITSWLESTRKMWMPTSGSGGQGQGWSLYQKLNQTMDQICQAGIKKYGDD